MERCTSGAGRSHPHRRRPHRALAHCVRRTAPPASRLDPDAADGLHGARLRVRQHRGDEVRHHLHRRRPGNPPLSRVPDRPACEELDLPRGRLAPHLRRAAHGLGARRLRQPHPPPHAPARRPQALLLGSAAHGPPHVGALFGGLRPLDLLRERDRPPQPRARRAQHDPDARQAPGHRRLRTQEERRSGVPLPRQLAELRRQLPQAQFRRALEIYEVNPVMSRALERCSSSTRTTSRTPRPRPCGSSARPVPTCSPRSRGHQRSLRPAARRRERGRSRDARPHPRLRRERAALRRAGQEQGGRGSSSWASATASTRTTTRVRSS